MEQDGAILMAKPQMQRSGRERLTANPGALVGGLTLVLMLFALVAFLRFDSAATGYDSAANLTFPIIATVLLAAVIFTAAIMFVVQQRKAKAYWQGISAQTQQEPKSTGLYWAD